MLLLIIIRGVIPNYRMKKLGYSKTSYLCSVSPFGSNYLMRLRRPKARLGFIFESFNSLNYRLFNFRVRIKYFLINRASSYRAKLHLVQYFFSLNLKQRFVREFWNFRTISSNTLSWYYDNFINLIYHELRYFKRNELTGLSYNTMKKVGINKQFLGSKLNTFLLSLPNKNVYQVLRNFVLNLNSNRVIFKYLKKSKVYNYKTFSLSKIIPQVNSSIIIIKNL
jgi:hypothetical protein